jgi:hypothetical protein
MPDAPFLHRFLDTLDHHPDEVLPLLAPGFRFSILWSDERGAHEFAGGLDEYRGYLAQRDADGQLHHFRVAAREGRSEVALGYTTRHGEELGNFTMFADVDKEERATRFFAARTLAFASSREP